MGRPRACGHRWWSRGRSASATRLFSPTERGLLLLVMAATAATAATTTAAAAAAAAGRTDVRVPHVHARVVVLVDQREQAEVGVVAAPEHPELVVGHAIAVVELAPVGEVDLVIANVVVVADLLDADDGGEVSL